LALNYLHNREFPIIHRDIKPDNFLLFENDYVKLGDFGLSVDENIDDKSFYQTVVLPDL